MPTTYRFPLLIWQDAEGDYTARVVEWEMPVGLGRTAKAAREQVADYLQWSYRQTWMGEPDLLEPTLGVFKIPVRPEYIEKSRRYPCDEPLVVPVHCVSGRQASGLRMAALPLLDIRFYYYEAEALKGLVTHYVQQHMEGLAPQRLSRYLPPERVLLDEVVLRVAAERDATPEFSLQTLRSVADPLGDPAVRRQFGRAWQRESAVTQLVDRLGKEKANVIVCGEAGAGKTTVMAEAVRHLERRTVDKTADKTANKKTAGKKSADHETDDADDHNSHLPRRRHWLTSAARLMAGMKYLGQWEERCERAIAELARIQGVLCVESLLDLVETGGRSPTDSAAAFLMPYLQRGELRLVTEATPAELTACRRLLPGFAELFQVLNLPPLGRAEAIKTLDHVAAAARQDWRIGIARGVVDSVYHLFRRFLPDAAFPGRATRFLADLFERTARAKLPDVTPEQAVAHFIRQTGLPEMFLRDEIPLHRDEVAATFAREVIGQPAACLAAANLVTTFKAGLNDPHRPVGVLLFCGPTGVGKTELARALSRFCFGHGEQRDRLIRLDMSEYAHPGAAERLISHPQGGPSELLKKIRQQPFVVLLLDEIEKADAEVFDVLMNVFDEGRLTDRFGRTTSFRSAMLIMTSNLGAGRLGALGFGERPAARYDAAALGFFRPEFYNRIDAVVTFDPLGPDTIRAITRKELAQLSEREGLRKAGLRLAWTDEVVEHVAQQGFDPRYGARPLQRTLETLVVTPLARELLTHPEWRDCELQVGLTAGRIVVTHSR